MQNKYVNRKDRISQAFKLYRTFVYIHVGVLRGVLYAPINEFVDVGTINEDCNFVQTLKQCVCLYVAGKTLAISHVLWLIYQAKFFKSCEINASGKINCFNNVCEILHTAFNESSSLFVTVALLFVNAYNTKIPLVNYGVKWNFHGQIKSQKDARKLI